VKDGINEIYIKSNSFLFSRRGSQDFLIIRELDSFLPGWRPDRIALNCISPFANMYWKINPAKILAYPYGGCDVDPALEGCT
jgi:hypothetical protein